MNMKRIKQDVVSNYQSDNRRINILFAYFH